MADQDAWRLGGLQVLHKVGEGVGRRVTGCQRRGNDRSDDDPVAVSDLDLCVVSQHLDVARAAPCEFWPIPETPRL